MHPEIVLGCPGAGKTTTLIGIVEEELKRGTPPDKIGYFAFTRKAANEATQRSCEKFNLTRRDFPHFSTIHSMCFKQLGVKRGEMLEGERMQEFAKHIGVRIDGKYSEDGTMTGIGLGDRVLFMENLARVRGIPLRRQYDDVNGDGLPWEEVNKISRALTEFKQAHGLMDFTDLLIEFVKCGQRLNLKVLIVDECFLHDTPILVGLDGSWLTIKNIVDQKYVGPIVSWHPEKGTIISKVIGHKKTLRNKQLVQIRFCVKEGKRGLYPGSQILVCTKDHKIKTQQGWVSANKLRTDHTVFVETAQLKVSSYQHRHKITSSGKMALSNLQIGNKRGLGHHRSDAYENFIKRRGGNGKGLAKHEKLFMDKLDSMNIKAVPYKSVKVGLGRNNGYPLHYKLDFFIEKGNIAIEIDGPSHRSRKKQDIKKTKRLQELGFDVVRFTNKEVATMTPNELKNRLHQKCFVEATVLSVEDYETKDTYVYDIEVADTHCYFAHGLLVHNCQDLSNLQWGVIDKLSEGCARVAVAGDDDQGIYSWAGADANHFIDMEGDVRVLGQSWRVPPVIQTLANSVISGVHHRRPKQWKARAGGPGKIDKADVFGDVDLGAGSVLILARNTYLLSKLIIPELRDRGVIYEYHGHSSVRAGLLEAIIDWERLRRGQRVAAINVKNIYEWMSSGRGVARGYKTLPGVQDEEELSLIDLKDRGGLLIETPWFESFDRTPVVEIEYLRRALKRGEKLGAKPRVVVSTVHGAKGGEAEHVVLIKELAARTNREMLANPDDERRVAYVGLTRARERLTLVKSSSEARWPWI